MATRTLKLVVPLFKVAPLNDHVHLENVSGTGSLRLDVDDPSISDLTGNALNGGVTSAELLILKDDDNDNIADSIESQVPNRFGTGVGDGNGDGIPDITQANVTSLIWKEQPTGSPSYVTLANSNGVTQVNVITKATPSNVPTGVNMPFGLVGFDLIDLTPGASITMSVFVDKSVPVNGYWKQNKAGTWVNIAESITTSGNTTRITFTLTDGGQFDTDGVVNGKISDPGGPGYFGAASLSMESFALPVLAPRNMKSLDFLVSFNTAVKNIDVSDFSVSGTGTAQGSIKQVTKVSDTTYQVTVDSIKGDGTLAVTTKAANAGNDITDAYGSVLNNLLSTTAHPLQNDISVHSSSEKIAALYTLMYHRAPDQSGLGYWLNEMAQGKTMMDISRAFAGNSRFTTDYATLTNQQFVELIYKEGLGNAGDAQGVGYWTKKLNDGQTRADLLADFALATMTIDLVKARDTKMITDAEYLSAVARQNALLNRIDLGLEFVKQFGSATNPMAASDLDPAYHAAQLVIANVGPTDQSLSDSLQKLHQTPTILNLLQVSPNQEIGVVGVSDISL